MNKHEMYFTADIRQTPDEFRNTVCLAIDGLMRKFYQENDDPLFHTFQLSCSLDNESDCIVIKTEMEYSKHKTVEQMLLSPSFIDALMGKRKDGD